MLTGSGVCAQDAGRGTSAALVHQTQDWQRRVHERQMGRHSENQRGSFEQTGGEGVPLWIQKLMAS